MKTYYYKIDKKTRRYYGGLNVKASIYTVKKGEIVKVGSCDWNTASYAGEVHTIFQALVELGQIPKKWLQSSVCEWRGEGYFDGEVCKHYAIKELP